MLQYSGRSNMKRVWLECGGKSPNIVLADCADLDRAATRGGRRRSSSTRARCARRRRAWSSRSRCATRCWRRSSSSAREMQPGDPLDPTTRLGAIVDEVQLRPCSATSSPAREGRDVLAGRQARARGDRRLLRRADRLRRREARDEDRARGNLRAGALGDHLQRRGGGGRDRERRRLRAGGRGVDARHHDGAPRRAARCAPGWCT